MANTTTAEKTAKVKTVKIKIPKTRENSDDVYVAVNGKSFLIKRGVSVEVPEYVAEVLEHSEEMQAESMEYEDSVKTEN